MLGVVSGKWKNNVNCVFEMLFIFLKHTMSLYPHHYFTVELPPVYQSQTTRCKDDYDWSDIGLHRHSASQSPLVFNSSISWSLDEEQPCWSSWAYGHVWISYVLWFNTGVSLKGHEKEAACNFSNSCMYGVCKLCEEAQMFPGLLSILCLVILRN